MVFRGTREEVEEKQQIHHLCFPLCDPQRVLSDLCLDVNVREERKGIGVFGLCGSIQIPAPSNESVARYLFTTAGIVRPVRELNIHPGSGTCV